MSICPKVLKKGKDEYTTFHMRIINGSQQEIRGRIEYTISMPNGKKDQMNLEKEIIVKANEEFNQYDSYYLPENPPIGRYEVDGKFYWEDKNILSATHPNDFFEVKE